MRSIDLVYMTSSSTGTPFSTSSVTGYDDFQDWFAQNQTFVASFKDGSDNYMVAICSLDGSNNVVVDRVLKSSAGATDLTVPTFSGTVDIVIGAAAQNTRTRRFRNCSSSDASHQHQRHLNDYIMHATSTPSFNSGQQYLFPHGVDVPGWYYGFYVVERTCTGQNYRLCLYDINEDGQPDIILMQTAEKLHSGGANVDTELDLDNTLTITDVSISASVGVVTYTGTDPTDGTRIYITDVVGTVGDDIVNNTSFLVSNVDAGANTFELHDLTNTDVATSGKTYTSGGTVHFPVFLSCGDYISSFIGDTNALNFNSPTVTDEMARPSGLGMRTGAAPVTHIKKTTTYGALSDTPDMTTGWSDDSTSMIGMGLLMVEG